MQNHTLSIFPSPRMVERQRSGQSRWRNTQKKIARSLYLEFIDRHRVMALSPSFGHS
jgi:hypothetical protein